MSVCWCRIQENVKHIIIDKIMRSRDVSKTGKVWLSMSITSNDVDGIMVLPVFVSLIFDRSEH